MACIGPTQVNTFVCSLERKRSSYGSLYGSNTSSFGSGLSGLRRLTEVKGQPQMQQYVSLQNIFTLSLLEICKIDSRYHRMRKVSQQSG